MKYIEHSTFMALTRKALLNHLNKSDKEDIIREVVTLFDKFKNVREFYSAELSDAANPLLDKYKKKIKEAYASPNPKERTTNINLNKLITDFRKISLYDRELIDLMLYRVECGVDAFILKKRRTSTFYGCILSTFETAIELIRIDGSAVELKKRIEKIVKDAQAGKFEIGEKIEQTAKKIYQ